MYFFLFSCLSLHESSYPDDFLGFLFGIFFPFALQINSQTMLNSLACQNLSFCFSCGCTAYLTFCGQPGCRVVILIVCPFCNRAVTAVWVSGIDSSGFLSPCSFQSWKRPFQNVLMITQYFERLNVFESILILKSSSLFRGM